MGVVAGSFTATGAGASFQVSGYYNIQLSGTFVGTFVLERSFDNGVTYVPISKNIDGVANSFTTPMSLVVFEPESGEPGKGQPNVLARWNCTAYTSGTCNWRISS